MDLQHRDPHASPSQDAEDATQEILLKAVTRLSSFEDRSSFRTWLYRIVVNHVLNMKRGRIEREGLNLPVLRGRSRRDSRIATYPIERAVLRMPACSSPRR